MAKATTASITYQRAENMATGFSCTCGYVYTVPPMVRNPNHAGNLVDSMMRYHEAKHKQGKIR